MSHYFFTGFPGFISSRLIRQLIRKRSDLSKIVLLVLPHMVSKAEAELAHIAEREQVPLHLFRVITGDITEKNLAIPADIQSELAGSITHVFHLAAIYDLAVEQHEAEKINVLGTEHVNQWLITLTELKHYIYFSTAYVSGKREGRILENELEANQSFKNWYEQTKYVAEVKVKAQMDRIPTTIVRPGIVIGDSNTGETSKFDGPYFFLNIMDRLEGMPISPFIGKGKAEGNFVPIDYITEATEYLTRDQKGIGATYHLTDPKPYQMNEVYQMLSQGYRKQDPAGVVSPTILKGLFSIPLLRQKLQVEKEAIDYFIYEAVYDTTQTQLALKDSGISCPDLKEYLPRIIEYYQVHKNDASKHLDIK
ncbi:SDR family oxidoreductase [Hazenella sp. IB182357]|uniref:SDR family oxidoreductase n=1 Tax=Polycladospora coralii TaxID=2771432 RepID=A0A926N7Q5_9BACL|nr:SDR family oxidoreductase [Polycladospora coralii]MBD1373511.1 SDR family oxidoreductase [Polycladospora coralii]